MASLLELYKNTLTELRQLPDQGIKHDFLNYPISLWNAKTIYQLDHKSTTGHYHQTSTNLVIIGCLHPEHFLFYFILFLFLSIYSYFIL